MQNSSSSKIIISTCKCSGAGQRQCLVVFFCSIKIESWCRSVMIRHARPKLIVHGAVLHEVTRETQPGFAMRQLF